MKKKRGHKRRAVKLVCATGEATIVFDDGTSGHYVFSNGDVTVLWETKPTGGCQRCGHDHSHHGDWGYDGSDEYWMPTGCSSKRCCCNEWIPFTPWYDMKA